MSSARRRRADVLADHIQAGTYAPRKANSHFTRPEIAAAIVADTNRPRLPKKQRRSWAWEAEHAAPPPTSLLAVLVTVP
jgi:hypothetical protein